VTAYRKPGMNIVDAGGRGRKAELSPPKQATIHAPTMLPLPDGDSVPIKVTTLGEVAQERKLDCIDFRKLDVEGIEPRILSGDGRLLAAGRAFSANSTDAGTSGNHTGGLTRYPVARQGLDDGMNGPPSTPLGTRYFSCVDDRLSTSWLGRG
jgi:hypothetical protein